MFKRNLAGFVAGVICTTVIAGGTAVAATGGHFILGKSNKSGTTTTLIAQRGPALSLKARGAALRVNNASKIANLNADKLDGLSSASFARSAAKSFSFDANGALIDVDGNGLMDAVVASARCPAGMQMTGGGYTDTTGTGVLVINAPGTGESWLTALAIVEGSGDTGSDVTTSVTCWSPTGRKPTGAYRPMTGARPTLTGAIPVSAIKQLKAKIAAVN